MSVSGVLHLDPNSVCQTTSHDTEPLNKQVKFLKKLNQVSMEKSHMISRLPEQCRETCLYPQKSGDWKTSKTKK